MLRWRILRSASPTRSITYALGNLQADETGLWTGIHKVWSGQCPSSRPIFAEIMRQRSAQAGEYLPIEEINSIKNKDALGSSPFSLL